MYNYINRGYAFADSYLRGLEQFDSIYIYRLSQLGAEQQENVFKTSLSTKKSFSGVKRTLELFSNKKGP